MKPMAEGEAPRTTFPVKDLLYVPRTVFRILSKTISSIKGHTSNTEEVVGIMKNLLFHIIHGTPINIHDFFLSEALCSMDQEIHQIPICNSLQGRQAKSSELFA